MQAAVPNRARRTKREQRRPRRGAAAARAFLGECTTAPWYAEIYDSSITIDIREFCVYDCSETAASHFFEFST